VIRTFASHLRFDVGIQRNLVRLIVSFAPSVVLIWAVISHAGLPGFTVFIIVFLAQITVIALAKLYDRRNSRSAQATVIKVAPIAVSGTVQTLRFLNEVHPSNGKAFLFEHNVHVRKRDLPQVQQGLTAEVKYRSH
jgi:hypothetical protein